MTFFIFIMAYLLISILNYFMIAFLPSDLFFISHCTSLICAIILAYIYHEKNKSS